VDYQAPEIRTLECRSIVEALGPALALQSGTGLVEISDSPHQSFIRTVQR
jgi:hypothetical protein